MMANKRDRKGLGRGLSALMADLQPEEPTQPEQSAAVSRAERTLTIDRITPNPDQPRRAFSDEALSELAASVAEKGIIQPLIVRPDPAASDMFQIVAGERRWRAAQQAKVHDVPVIVRQFNDTEVLEVAIIENIQRADLNAVEEAQGYRQLMDRFGHTQEQLATAMGKSRSHIANLMRLLGLPGDVLDMIRDGRLSAGHARALITTDDPSGLALQAVAKGLSVRDIEKLAKSGAAKGSKGNPAGSKQKDADTRALEGDLSAALGLGVSIDHDQKHGSGKITIKYKDLAEFDDLLRVLNKT